MPHDRRYVRELQPEERRMIAALGRLQLRPMTDAWRFRLEMQRLVREPAPRITMTQARQLRAVTWMRRADLPPEIEPLTHVPIGSFRPVAIPTPREDSDNASRPT